MKKRYAITALVYASLALAFGVFYREFTKFNGFTGQTNLSVMHTHYLLLGTVVFLVLLFAEKLFAFSNKTTFKLEILYHVGLNITGIAFLMRGIVQVTADTVSKGLDASISGIAGIGHAALGVALIWILVQIVLQVARSEKADTQTRSDTKTKE